MLKVFESRSRRTFGAKTVEIIRGWEGKLHNEEFIICILRQVLIRMINSERKRWARDVARVGRKGTRREIWWEKEIDL
jgi:hypothetical protein